MKPKGICQECGKLICSNKLHKSMIDGRLLCSFHYKQENKQRNGSQPNERPVLPGLSNSTENKKTRSGGAKMSKNNSYVIRGEEEILKKKYGKAYCNHFNKLKKALGNTRMKMIQDNTESIDRQKREKELNKKLVEGLR